MGRREAPSQEPANDNPKVNEMSFGPLSMTWFRAMHLGPVITLICASLGFYMASNQ